MRVFIICDMEGVAGIIKWDQTSGGDPMYEEGRALYTEEINAAVRGAQAAGATEIVVMDCHGAGGGWSFNSLLPERLDPACEFVVQHEWTEYTELPRAGLRRGALRRHACEGRDAGRRAQPHGLGLRVARTSRSTARSSARAASTRRCAAHWGCPVLLVTGDDAVVPRGARAARRRADDGRGEDGPRHATAPATSRRLARGR